MPEAATEGEWESGEDGEVRRGYAPYTGTMSWGSVPGAWGRLGHGGGLKLRCRLEVGGDSFSCGLCGSAWFLLLSLQCLTGCCEVTRLRRMGWVVASASRDAMLCSTRNDLHALSHDEAFVKEIHVLKLRSHMCQLQGSATVSSRLERTSSKGGTHTLRIARPRAKRNLRPSMTKA